MRTIEINLAKQDVGTTALVTERKWLKKVTKEYVCLKAGRLSGGYWAEVGTGKLAGSDLEWELNTRAQNAVYIARVKGLLPV